MMKNSIPIGPIRAVEWVNIHCMKRATERLADKGATVGEVLVLLERMLDSSHSAVLKPERKINKILNHDGRLAKYRVYLNGRPRLSYKEIPEEAWIMVFHDDNTLATIHQNNSREWEFEDDEE